MSDTTTTTAVPELNLAQQYIANQKVIQQDKDWKLSEASKLTKEMNKELAIITNAKKKALEEYTVIINEQFKPEVDAIKAKYQAQLKPFQLITEDKMSAIGTVVGEKGAEIVNNSPVRAIIDAGSTFKTMVFGKK